MRRNRVLRVAALATAGLIGLTACGGGGKEKESGPVSLRMTIWSSAAPHLALFNSIADEYKKTHKNVKEIRFDSIPIDSYTTTLTTQIAGGKGPDLAWILEGSAPDFVSSGALLPLDETLGRTKDYNAADLAPAATKLWKADGKLYAYPFSTSPFGVFVNTNLIKQAGQQTPAELIKSGKWTWETAIAEGAAVKARTKKAGIVIRDFDYKTWENLATFWTGWGAEAWSADGKTCGFDKPEMVDAMTALHKAIFTDKALPGPGEAADFFAGESAMTVTQISRASLLKDAKFGWDLVPLPAGPKGPYSVIGQAGLGVFKNSKNPQAAAEFLAYLTNPGNSAKLAQFFPPARQSQLNVETLAKSQPLLKPAQLQAVVVDGTPKGIVKPSHKGSAELSQSVRSALDALWKPGADVKSVLGAVCTAIAPQLSK
jgi:multiple sugar transport system substrate-binding protein